MKLLVLIVAVLVIGLSATVFTRNPPKSSQPSPTNPVFFDKGGLPLSGVYTQYPGNFYSSKSQKRVLFFHASWCPTCKIANAEFESRTSEIPEDVIVFKTDYDSESELKAKYGITYQHTFVLVDSDGNEIKKWNGGGIAELMANTK